MIEPIALRRSAQRAVIAAAFFISTLDIFANTAQRFPQHAWLAQISIVVLLFGSLIPVARLSVSNPARLTSALRRAWPALGLLGMGLLSIRWSINRPVSIDQIQWIVVLTVVGIAIATIDDLTLAVDGLAIFGTLSLLWSTWLARKVGIYQDSGNWLGPFGNRNGLGALACFSYPAILAAARGSWVRRVLGSGAGLLVAIVVVKTRSKTSLISFVVLTLVFAGMVYVSYRVARGAPKRRSTIEAAVVTFVLLAVSGLAVGTRTVSLPAGYAFDRTLSLRTYMWSSLRPFAKQEWLRGYGYRGFWSGARGYLLAAQANAKSGTAMVTAHNGYYQELLASGIGGLFFAVACTVAALRRGWKSAETGPRGSASFLLLMAIALTLQNLMEAMFSEPRGLPWALWVFCLALPVGVVVRSSTTEPTTAGRVAGH